MVVNFIAQPRYGNYPNTAYLHINKLNERAGKLPMILSALRSWMSKKPDALAIIDHDTPITYANFVEAIYATRNMLSAEHLGLPPQGTVAVMSSGYPMWCIQLALRSMGLNTVFVRNLTEASSLRFKDLVAVVTTPRNIAIRGADAPLGFTCKLITLPDGFWHAPNPGLPTDNGAETPSFGNHFLYTSGTTGEYKKVMVDSRLEHLQAERVVKLGRMSEDAVLHVLGFGGHTVLGYRIPTTAWFSGATIIIDERPDVLANLLRHSPTEFTLTPDLASAVAAHPPKLDAERPVPTVLLGGGFVSYKIVQTLRQAGFTDIRNAFAATECPRVLHSAVDSEDSLVWLETHPDRDVEIIDEDGRICDYGQEGKIRIKLLEHDATGYFDDPEATAAAFSDGWFYPGDLAIRRHDNRIRILGRAGDVINLLGVKQATAPFEQAVQQITHASAVCIFQEVRLDGTDELVVALEAEDSPSSETLDRIRSLFPEQTALRVKVLPAFPRTTLGMSKIKRLQLRKMVSVNSEPQPDKT